ncbi:MAG: efflux RND transporter periplasmic adaptor subunit [Mangrovicoccus sp.]
MRLTSIFTAILVAIGLYVLVFERDLLFAADTTATPEEPAPETQKKPASASELPPGHVAVVAIKSDAIDVDNRVILRGRTEADRQVAVKSQIEGLVISTPLRKGNFVTKGQLLCEIEPGTRPATLAQARAQLAEAEISNTAASRLAEGGYRSETAAVAAKATYEAALAAVQQAEWAMGHLQITAPFDGLLETDAAELGTLLQAGSDCATVIQLDPIKLVGYLPETQVSAVKLGAPVTARLTDGRVITGTVSFVARSSDPATRTFEVDVTVENPDLSIRDGQTVEMAISAEGSRAHLIPQSALTLNDSGEMGVRLVDAQSQAAFAPVEIVRDTPEGMLVRGLPDSVQLITVGQEYVNDGVPVIALAPGERL